MTTARSKSFGRLQFDTYISSIKTSSRGRDGSYLAPPAQTRTGRFPACGLSQIRDVEAQVGIRMKDFGPGKPLCSETSQVLPRHPAFLAATLQNPQPAFAHFTPKALETGEVSGNGMIVEVALHHASQVLHDRATLHQRSCWTCGSSPSPTGPLIASCRALIEPPDLARGVSMHAGVSDLAEYRGRLRLRVPRYCLPPLWTTSAL